MCIRDSYKMSQVKQLTKILSLTPGSASGNSHVMLKKYKAVVNIPVAGQQKNLNYNFSEFSKNESKVSTVLTAKNLTDSRKLAVKIKKSLMEDINISCLLYTSPSPRDLSTSRMPSSA
eukprot:TRINITY_DN12271_c0_g1_i1.p2 TRINITY_DN12271_c0_g1~~TRINITY_DN12271_c0_g1_i1.p2  ORF type:complete len:134 (-),score=54.02 TRINITY_DN12271_c0_g1_i1:17-370(-)